MSFQVLRQCYLPIALLLVSPFATAQEEESVDLTDEQQQQLAYYRSIVESLEPRSGDIQLDNDLATLHVPEDFYFLDAENAEKVLVEIWGNPPGQDVLGMLFPAQFSPLDYDAWAVTVDYVPDGWVSDEDAASIDYDDLLRDMQAGTREANEEREAAGYGTIELLGWAEPPHYDTANKKLYWAKELRFDGADETTLNYEIRALGRRGVLTMTFIAGSDQLAEINASRESVLAMAEFNDGHRYADFDPDLDTVAAYGLGALVAGKVAAKAGLLTAGLIALKKFGVFLIVGLAALGRKLKGLLSTTQTLAPK